MEYIARLSYSVCQNRVAPFPFGPGGNEGKNSSFAAHPWVQQLGQKPAGLDWTRSAPPKPSRCKQTSRTGSVENTFPVSLKGY